MRLNRDIPDDIEQGIQDVIDQLTDLISEMERGDPPAKLLAKKDAIIQKL